MKINLQAEIVLLAFIYIPNILVHANAIDKINPVKNNIIVQENAVKVKRESPVSNEDSSLQFNEMKLIKSTPEKIIDKLHILEKRSPIDVLKSTGDSASRSFDAFKPSDSIYAEPFKHTNVGPQLEAGLHRNRKRSPMKNWFSSFTKGSTRSRPQSDHIYEEIPENLASNYKSKDYQKYQSGGGYKSGSHASSSHDHRNSIYGARSRPQSEHIYEEIPENLASNYKSKDHQKYQSGGGYKSGSHSSSSGPSGWKRPSGLTKDHSTKFQDELKAAVLKRRPH
ncbi:hypothetical protein PV325_006764 [Microctonus aethiopoides]|nr:hypothetical protein PV325_006764 [Microctonus aethiopoides]